MFPGFWIQNAPLAYRGVVFEEDYEQFLMERGYCVIGGAEKYTPQLVRNRVLSQPNAWLSVIGRASQISFKLGSFLTAWSADKFLGRANNPEYVQIRASQLR